MLAGELLKARCNLHNLLLMGFAEQKATSKDYLLVQTNGQSHQQKPCLAKSIFKWLLAIYYTRKVTMKYKSTPPLLLQGSVMDLLEQLVVTARISAVTGIFDGTPLTQGYLFKCRHAYSPMTASVIFTRDEGHHSSGWWKNPDYERCFHLSVSFQGGFTKKRGEILAKAFFGRNIKYLWVEPPHSKTGKQNEVWHYRLFCDKEWKPIKPKGEVYSRNMPKEWMSFSEVQAKKKTIAR